MAQRRQRRERGSISVDEIINGAFAAAGKAPRCRSDEHRGHYSAGGLHGALQEIEHPVTALVEAGLTPEQAVETYGALSVHTRGSVVLERLQNKTVAGRGGGTHGTFHRT